MRWRSGRRSQNVEDRRGSQRQSGSGGPSGYRLPGSRMRIPKKGGIGGIGLLILIVAGLFFGFDPSTLFTTQTTSPTSSRHTPSQSAPRSATDQELADFVSVVLADTEDTWKQLFSQLNRTYQEPRLVLFSGYVQSACGMAQSASGPFYCPGDRKIYIDLDFYDELRYRFRAPGDFAQAYVIAHEIGHHVQNLLGILGEVDQARSRSSRAEANALSVRLELQADCLAGVWAHHAERQRDLLEAGDVEEGLNAASAIGDDRMQRQGQGYVVPDSFTHGSSVQRVRWFRQGLESGDVRGCNTFSTDRL